MIKCIAIFTALSFFLVVPVFVQAAPVPESFADLAQRLTPSVVNISTTQVIDQNFQGGYPLKPFPPGHPFEDFNEFFDQFGGPQGKQKATSLGSGFVISPDGLVVTNNHVVEAADEITVTFHNKQQYAAEVIGRDPKTDLAVLKIDTEGREIRFLSVKFGDSDKIRVGDWVVAIGNPFGLGGTVTAGIISARARDINAGPFDDFLQTDAAINRGNSGGPMFNLQGEVIGVNAAIYSPTGGNVGIGFAIPSAMAKPVIEQLKQGKTIRRGWLGVKIQTVTDEIAESLGIEKKGALVVEVTDDSPADKAGLKPGDVIVKFDGKDVPEMRKLPRLVAGTDVGKRVNVTVIRGGDKKSFKLNLGELKDEETKRAQIKPDKKDGEQKGETVLGMRVVALNNEVRERYGIDEDAKGLLVLKVEGGAAAENGISGGDIIVKANQQDVTSVKALETQIEEVEDEGRKAILLLIDREGTNIFVALPVKEED